MPGKQVVFYKRKAKEDGGRGSNRQRERVIQRIAAGWMRSTFPDLVFFNDWASGAYLTAGQNKARLALACNNGWVDLFIAEPSRGYHGCFIEIKKEGVTLHRKDGKIRADKQIQKEAAFLLRQRQKGYCCLAASGLEDLKKKIRWYIGQELPENGTIF